MTDNKEKTDKRPTDGQMLKLSGKYLKICSKIEKMEKR